MDRYDSFIHRHATPHWRTRHVVVVGLVGAFLLWASVAQLDQVATTSGEVIPAGKVKVIQHLEGGIVAAIEVAEGDRVKAGDPLVVLDLATSGMNRSELQANLDQFLLSRARLEAETADGLPRFPEDVALRRPELAESERQAFEAKRQELNKSLAVIDLQIQQREKEIVELRTKRQSAERDLGLAREELAMKEVMLQEDLTSKLTVLKSRQDATRLSGELDVTRQTLERVMTALPEYQARREELLSRYRREASDKLAEANREISRLKERLSLADDQKIRATIRSPANGVVKNVKYPTVGGVVRAGEPIMEIVPSEEALEVEARLAPSDRGYVTVGQPAKVMVTAYDFVRYGSLDGQVAGIAANTDVDPKLGAFYRVTVRTGKSHLGNNPDQYPIRPGMQATVDIHVGRQTVMAYLLRPVLKAKHDAFREP